VRLPYELHLALRYLRFHRGRTFLSIITLISVAGVTVGTAALVIALALATGFQEDVRDRILGGSAHLTVLSAADATFSDAEALALRVARIPGVRAVGPVLFSPAMVTSELGDLPAYAEIEGVDPSLHGAVVPLGGGERDPLASLKESPGEGEAGIVLGEQLARRLAVRTGDPVRVVVPRVTLTPFAPIPRSRVFRVVGTFRSDYFQQDAQRAYVALPEARRLLGTPTAASWVEVRLEDPDGLEPAKASLRSALGSGWSVVDLLEQNQAMLKALNTEKLILFLAIGLIVVVASLNIVSTLILMVTDKVKEIGTLTSMGARPAAIASVFMLQGVVIGLVGTTLGLALGAAVAWWLDRYEVIGLNPEVAARAKDLAFVGALTFLVSFVATLYPAWKAASQDPVEAIRHE
jgi:lipoprotein-releasing system permease protein